MPKSVGGRGKTAPYKTVMVRTPEPIKERVEELKQLYFSGQLEEYDKSIANAIDLSNKYKEELLNKQLSDDDFLKVTNRDEILDLSRRLLKHKKSTKETVRKLLSALLGENITLEDLQ